jgi:arsenite methyltransferase
VGLRDEIGLAVKRVLYEGFGRDKWQQPERVIAALALQPGDVIADLGSGTGYFTLRFARAVGPNGRVFAVDTDGGLLAAIEQDARKAGMTGVTTVQAKEGGVLELPEPADVVFLSNVFHHLPAQAGYFRAARSQLRPGGRVAILESKPEGLFARWFGHATAPATVQQTMAEAGYEAGESYDFVERRSFQLFRAPYEAHAVEPSE